MVSVDPLGNLRVRECFCVRDGWLFLPRMTLYKI